MWKRPEDKPQSGSPSTQPGPAATPANSGAAPRETRSADAPKAEPFRHDVAAHIGKSVLVKGELSGSEDLYFDGEVEGSVDLRNHSLVIGPNGRIRANIAAREITIHGRVEGNVNASERAELKKSCVLIGDVSTQRIVIEDGAFFKGSVDLKKDGKTEQRTKPAASVTSQPAVSSGASSATNAASATNGGANSGANSSPQSSLLEHK
jgi:cytoskeletal protein CcmA (bactofilin family)